MWYRGGPDWAETNQEGGGDRRDMEGFYSMVLLCFLRMATRMYHVHHIALKTILYNHIG